MGARPLADVYSVLILALLHGEEKHLRHERWQCWSKQVCAIFLCILAWLAKPWFWKLILLDCEHLTFNDQLLPLNFSQQVFLIAITSTVKHVARPDTLTSENKRGDIYTSGRKPWQLCCNSNTHCFSPASRWLQMCIHVIQCIFLKPFFSSSFS